MGLLLNPNKYYWWRLPAGEETERLRRAYGARDITTLLQMMNRYQITAQPLSICCDVETAFAAAALHLKNTPTNET